ncbi:MAG TPA: acetyl-CoA carboxylase biotin carboxylase subunit, partial [Hyphomonadaceae bacterium]|nr:acetyl-CoA carboxylase biotin carboxylase subunit [Hyphomonadaceae bacterium]
ELSLKQKDVVIKGHAIECRINAENPETFTPSPGLISDFHAPGGLGVRLDSAVYSGYRVPPHYDSLIGKLIVYAPTRAEAIARLRRALGEMVVVGVETTLPLHMRLVNNADVQKGAYDIHWLEKFLGMKK